MALTKGNSLKFVCTVYTDADNKVLADLTGALVKLIVKRRDTDLDSAALVNKAGAVTSIQNGTCEALLLASESNSLFYNRVVWEIVVKLLDGTFIRTGAQPLDLETNVLKALF
jgi:hypothetical protein